MKRCPECRRDYYDDTLSFCLEDGTPLVQGSVPVGHISGEEPATAILSEPGAVGTGFRHGEDQTRPQIHRTDQTAIYPRGSEAEPDGKLGELSERHSHSAHRAAKPLSGRTKLLVGFGIAVLLLVGGFFGYRYFGSSGKQIESIAVMPFVNEGGNADVEYLSDGMTESLINSLSKLPNLSVQARSSVFHYKGQNVAAKTVAAELNVQAVLNGRVVQRGDALTLYLSLVDAASGTLLWGEQYDRNLSDLTALQSDIALDVSRKLRMRLSNDDQQRLTKSYTANAEAYQLYLKGRYFWNKRTPEDFQKSRDYFQRAINLDPAYALAYSGLADYYGISTTNGQLPPDETWPKHEAIVRKALELDPNLSEAHSSMAGLLRWYYRDLAGAEREFKRAIELNPDNAEAHTFYGGILASLGRFDEALVERRRGLELDPLAPSINMRLGDTFYQMERFDDAIEQYRKAIELDPGSVMFHNRLGDVYERKRMHVQAIAEWSEGLKVSKNGDLATLLEQTFEREGFESALRALARKRLEFFDEKVRRGEYVPARDLARLHMRLGNRDQTFFWLEKAARERNAFAFEIRRDPIFAALRDEPRFQDVVQRAESPL